MAFIQLLLVLFSFISFMHVQAQPVFNIIDNHYQPFSENNQFLIKIWFLHSSRDSQNASEIVLDILHGEEECKKNNGFNLVIDNIHEDELKGIADYVRSKAGNPSKDWPKRGSGLRWDEGNAITAYFLECSNSLRSGLVADRNALMKNPYTDTFFMKLLGKTPCDIWLVYKSTYGADFIGKYGLPYEDSCFIEIRLRSVPDIEREKIEFQLITQSIVDMLRDSIINVHKKDNDISYGRKLKMTSVSYVHSNCAKSDSENRPQEERFKKIILKYYKMFWEDLLPIFPVLAIIFGTFLLGFSIITAIVSYIEKVYSME